MVETLISCPNCHHCFAVSEALSAQVEADIDARLKVDYEARLARATQEAVARSGRELKLLQEQLADQQRKLSDAQDAELALRREKAVHEFGQVDGVWIASVRAMEKIWKEREKQIERVVAGTVGMYGEMSGILGGSLSEIPALSLEAVLRLPGEAE